MNSIYTLEISYFVNISRELIIVISERVLRSVVIINMRESRIYFYHQLSRTQWHLLRKYADAIFCSSNSYHLSLSIFRIQFSFNKNRLHNESNILEYKSSILPFLLKLSFLSRFHFLATLMKTNDRELFKIRNRKKYSKE